MWVRPLAAGERALVLLNRNLNSPTTHCVKLDELWLAPQTATVSNKESLREISLHAKLAAPEAVPAADVVDVWARRPFGRAQGVVCGTVDAASALMLRLSPVA